MVTKVLQRVSSLVYGEFSLQLTPWLYGVKRAFWWFENHGNLYKCALYGGLSRDNGPTLTPLRPNAWQKSLQLAAQLDDAGAAALLVRHGGRGRYRVFFVKDLKELKWPRFEMMNNCLKLCDLKTDDHVQSCNCSALASAVVWKTRISYVSQGVFPH